MKVRGQKIVLLLYYYAIMLSSIINVSGIMRDSDGDSDGDSDSVIVIVIVIGDSDTWYYDRSNIIIYYSLKNQIHIYIYNMILPIIIYTL